MAKGVLRVAIERMIAENFSPSGGPGWWERVKQRWQEYDELQKQFDPAKLQRRDLQGTVGLLPHTLYALTGSEFYIRNLRTMVAAQKDKILPNDASETVAQVLRQVFSQPLAREVAETIGAAITEPVLSIFEQYAGRDDLDPKEFARAFHGFMIALNTAGGLADTVLETVSGGQIEGVGRFLQSMYWSLGLGFLGWQTLAPLLSAGLQPGLERYYQRLYRPMRFNASDLRDLYALGEITQEEMRDEARTLGWRDQDIARWIKLAFRTLSQGDVFTAYHKGLIDQDEAVKRLRALGYDPQDIPLLFQLNPPPDTDEARSVSSSTVRQAYREHLISADEARAMLQELRYQPREIDLILALEDQRNLTEARSLSASQIRDAWSNNILSDAEVMHWLTQSGYDTATAQILLDTWKAQQQPAFMRLNKGTILGAYIEGILTKAQAREKLLQIGFRAEDADLEIALVEARNPEAFGRAARPRARELTPGVLSSLVAAGLISPDEMRERLIALGYASEDATLLASAAAQRLIEQPEPLTQATVERAYITGVLNRDQAMQRLTALDFTAESAAVILDTVERENPEAFHPELVTTLRVPSITSLAQAVANGIITEQEFYNRAAELGFRTEDARIYLALAITSPRKSTRSLSASQIANAYGAGIFPHALARQKLIEQGYSDYDAGVILRLEKPAVSEDDTWLAFLSGQIDAITAIQTLIANRYAIEDIRAALHALRPDVIDALSLNLAELDAFLNEISSFVSPQI